MQRKKCICQMRRVMFHTQEKRDNRLYQPILCTRRDAWLGHGYYFWGDEYDADVWGITTKKKTGRYEVYVATIEGEQILDTVFCESDYQFFLEAIQKVISDCRSKSGRSPSIADVCSYLMNVAKWNTILNGVLFSDTPNTEIEKFNYRKRIQMVLYNLKCLVSFKFLKEERCKVN